MVIIILRVMVLVIMTILHLSVCLIPVVSLWMGQMVEVMLIVVDVVVVRVEIVRVLIDLILVLMIFIFVVGKASLDIVLMVIVGRVVRIIQDVVVLANIPEDVMLCWVDWYLIFPLMVREWDAILLLTCRFLHIFLLRCGWSRGLQS